MHDNFFCNNIGWWSKKETWLVVLGANMNVYSHYPFIYFFISKVQCSYLLSLCSETWWNYCTSWWSLVSLNLLYCIYFCFWINFSNGFFLVYSLCTSMFPKCTHESFSQKLYEKFKNNKRFSKPKLSRTAFTIQHYAGEVRILHNIAFLSVHLVEYIPLNFMFLFQVTYQSDHFLDKNRDYVVVEHQELLNASRCSFVSGLFPSVLEENTKASKTSIATRFKVWFSYSPTWLLCLQFHIKVGWRKIP